MTPSKLKGTLYKRGCKNIAEHYFPEEIIKESDNPPRGTIQLYSTLKELNAHVQRI